MRVRTCRHELAVVVDRASRTFGAADAAAAAGDVSMFFSLQLIDSNNYLYSR
jgi:hypothetical protein